MEKLLLLILRMSLAGSVVILSILVLRLVLLRAPRKYGYLLWSVAAFRLCVPLSLPSPISLFRLLSRPAAAGSAALAPLGLRLPGEAAAITADTGNYLQAFSDAEAVPVIAGTFPWLRVLTWVWLAGLGAFLLQGLISTLLLRRRLGTAVRLEGDVYQAEGLASPFLMGVFRPRIYIPPGLEGADLEYALAHERCHLYREDHLFRLLAWVIRCVHWFNPLVWLAWVLMGRDMELSCDEAVLEKLGDVRSGYSKSLLRMALNRAAPERGPAPLAFGESGVARRVRNVLRWRRAKDWITVVSLVLSLLFIAACATDPEARLVSSISNSITLNPDGTIDSLRWGMSPEEAMAADSRIVLAESENRFVESAELKGASVLGHTADIHLIFSKRKLEEDGLHKGPDGRPILDEIKISIPGEVSVTEALSQVFGEQEKRMPDNSWEMVDGLPQFNYRPYELPEEKWFWHTDPVFTDIPIEQLRLSIPDYEDTELLGAWCSVFGCKVYAETFESEEGTSTEVSLFGYGSALQRFLAEEYQRITEEKTDGT